MIEHLLHKIVPLLVVIPSHGKAKNIMFLQDQMQKQNIKLWLILHVNLIETTTPIIKIVQGQPYETHLIIKQSFTLPQIQSFMSRPNI